MLVPQTVKRWIQVGELLKVGRCPWVGQREREWRLQMREEGEQEQELFLSERTSYQVKPVEVPKITGYRQGSNLSGGLLPIQLEG